MVGQTYHFARSLCSFHSVWSHHSKDLQQWTNVTAHLLLKILLSRQQIVYSRKGKALRPPKKDLNSAWLSFFMFSGSSLPGAWLVLPYAKQGSCQPLVRSSVQWLSQPDSLPPHRPGHVRPPGVYSNSCPVSLWFHPTISFSVVPFSSCLQSFPASRSFQMS